MHQHCSTLQGSSLHKYVTIDKCVNDNNIYNSNIINKGCWGRRGPLLTSYDDKRRTVGSHAILLQSPWHWWHLAEMCPGTKPPAGTSLLKLPEPLGSWKYFHSSARHKSTSAEDAEAELESRKYCQSSARAGHHCTVLLEPMSPLLPTSAPMFQRPPRM